MRNKKVLCPGYIVQSRAGHDKDRIYIIISIEGEFLYLADGDYRKLDNCKKKRNKHIRFLAEGSLPEKLTDAKIKRIIKEWRMYAQRG